MERAPVAQLRPAGPFPGNEKRPREAGHLSPSHSAYFSELTCSNLISGNNFSKRESKRERPPYSQADHMYGGPGTSDPGSQYYNASNPDSLAKGVTGRGREDGTLPQIDSQRYPVTHLSMAQA